MHTMNSKTNGSGPIIDIAEPSKPNGTATVVVLKPPVAPATRAPLEAVAPVQGPNATKPPAAAPRKRRVALAKAKSGKKTTPAKKAPKRAKGPKAGKKDGGPRKGSKIEKVLDLLKRPKGATLAELMKATNWQPHSVRGFLSGMIGKKLGLAVESTKSEDRERRYSVKA